MRPSDWDWGVEVQQEVLPRVSVSVGFFHRELFGFTVTDNLAIYSDRYSDQYQKFNAIDMSFNARPRNGITVQGGFSGGYATSDNCAVREKVPEIALLNPFCHVETSFMPQYKGLGSYIVHPRALRHPGRPGERARPAVPEDPAVRLTPTSILSARFAKISAQFDF